MKITVTAVFVDHVTAPPVVADDSGTLQMYGIEQTGTGRVWSNLCVCLKCWADDPYAADRARSDGIKDLGSDKRIGDMIPVPPAQAGRSVVCRVCRRNKEGRRI